MNKKTHIVRLQELLRIVIAIDVNLGKGVEDCRVLAASLYTCFEPEKNELKPVTGLNLVNKLVDSEVTRRRGQQRFDCSLVTIDAQQPSDNLRCPAGVDTLYVNPDKDRRSILIEVENQVVHEVETIADNDNGKLVHKLGFFEEVLYFLRAVLVTLPADALDLTDLIRAS